MKKILSTTLIVIVLSTTLVDTINADAPRRPVVRRQSQGQPARRRIIRRKRNLPEPTGKASPRQVTQAAKQAEVEAKKLQADAKKAQEGKASEKVVVADVRKVEANIGKIEQQLANLRTWSGDVLPGGYSLAEKNKAQDIAAPYIKESEALKQRVKMNQDKIALITTKTWFGFGTPKVNPGKQEEYDRYKKLIAIDEIRLAKLAPIIAQQEVIMGTARSTAVKSAYAAMAIAAITIGADIYYGGAISGAAMNTISSIYETVVTYTPTPIVTAATKLKAGWDYLMGNVSVEDLAKGAAASLTEEKKQSWINHFGKEIADTAWAISSVVAQAGSTILLEEGAKAAYLQVQQVLGNEKATPADAERALNRFKGIMDKVEKEKKAAARAAEIEAEKAEREARKLRLMK